MKERPILFSSAMAPRLLDGSKTQTRRLPRKQPIGRPWFWAGDSVDPEPMWFDGYTRGEEPRGAPTEDVNDPMRCRYGEPGDRLWVRETWAWPGEEGYIYRADQWSADMVEKWKTDPNYPQVKWKPSIFMPRWASRINLEIIGVKVERLQDISEEDAKAEGVGLFIPSDGTSEAAMKFARAGRPFAAAFCALWHQINGPESRDENLWVWCLEFKRLP